MSKPRSQNVQYEITDNFLKFWFNYFDRNQTLVEMGNYDRFREIVVSDYPTYSGRILEKYFRLKMKPFHTIHIHLFIAIYNFLLSLPHNRDPW